MLWENPNPKAEFPAQTIELYTLDFDIYDVYYSYNKNNDLLRTSRSFKGAGTFLNFINTANQGANRSINWVSPNKLQIGNANYYSVGVSNDALVPIAIYGYKL